MAQSALTVTPPNPTPPTNFTCTGATPPNVPNYTKNTYNDPKNWSSVNPKDFPPPYFDDGSALTGTAFAANTAALASGSAATAGGGEGTYPGAGSPPFNPNMGGAVPASSSVAHEGAGSEVVVTAAVPNPSPAGQLQTVSCLGNFTGIANAAGQSISPNATHASSLSPAVNPALTSVAAGGASGGGNATCTATGTNFTKQSVLQINGITYPTTFVSSTSLTASAPKKATAGSLPVYVITGGVVISGPQNWTFT